MSDHWVSVASAHFQLAASRPLASLGLEQPSVDRARVGSMRPKRGAYLVDGSLVRRPFGLVISRRAAGFAPAREFLDL